MSSDQSGQPGFQTPFALSFMVCDAVHTDHSTGKRIIIGTFSAISAPQFPAVHPSLWVYMELTDGRGIVPLRVRVVDIDEEVEVFVAEDHLDMVDPLTVQVLAIQINGLSFPAPGEYRIQLFTGETPVIERRLMLIQEPTQDKEQS